MELSNNTPQSDRSSIRTIACQNMTDEWIPAFACMLLDGYGRDVTQGYGWYESDGEALVKVTKPNRTIEQDQNQAVLYINGPTPIPPKGFGRCTRDWPAEVLHDGRIDGLGPSMPCGPKAGRWEVFSSGFAFTSLGHNKTCDKRPQTSSLDNLHTVLITGETVESRGGFATAHTTGAKGATPSIVVTPQKSYIALFPHDGNIVADSIPGDSTNQTIERGWIVSSLDGQNALKMTSDRYAGWHYLSLGATIWAYPGDLSQRGREISIAAKHYNGAGQLQRIFKASRVHDVETDEYGVVKTITRENVFVGGITPIAKDDKIILINDSSIDIVVQYPSFSIFQLDSARFQSSSGPGE